MKAIVYDRYGSSEVLRYEEIAKPTPRDDQVLIRVRAASINPLDWHFMRGTPYLLRMAAGLSKPNVTRLGTDVAGHVEVLGRNVTEFKAGDEVFGTCQGAFAEYACAAPSALAMKPKNVTFEQAAAVPVAAVAALQSLRDKARIQPRQTVLINGAAGGVGTFAVQIARWFGASVTGVCSTQNIDLVRSIGANRVIDYTQRDFTTDSDQYDVIVDCVGNRSLIGCRRALTATGTYIMVGAPDRRWIGPFGRATRVLMLSPFVSQNMTVLLVRSRKEDLLFMQALLAEEKIRPIVDRCYPLSEAAAAIRYQETGHAHGKVVITVGGSDADIFQRNQVQRREVRTAR